MPNQPTYSIEDPMTRARVLLVGALATDEADGAVADVTTISADEFQRSQLRGRFDSIVVGSDALGLSLVAQRLIAHSCAVHLLPAGRLTLKATSERFAADLVSCGLHEVSRSESGSLWRRTARRTIHDVLADARDRLTRVDAPTLQAELTSGHATVVDIRADDDRRQYGVIHPSLAIPRTALEWRLDPTSGYSHPDFTSFDQRIVVVCNDGYGSSIAAAALVELGYVNATDLVGGFKSWLEHGLPVTATVGDE